MSLMKNGTTLGRKWQKMKRRYVISIHVSIHQSIHLLTTYSGLGHRVFNITDKISDVQYLLCPNKLYPIYFLLVKILMANWATKLK